MRRRSEPKFTFFHVLWIEGALASAAIAYFALRSVLWSIVAGVAGFFVSGIAVTALVVYIVIPCVTPGSRWDYEAGCFMAFMLPNEWPRD